MKKAILFFSLTVFCITASIAQSSPSRVVGYIPTWVNFSALLHETDFSSYSHIMLAFANPDIDGNVSIGASEADVKRLIRKAHQSGCLVLMSIGGGSTTINDAWHENMKSSNRPRVIGNLIAFMQAHGFDGIDVDLEGDLVLSSAYPAFVRELDERLPETKLYTAAMATWSATNLQSETLDRYDFIGVMSYDQTGPWTPNAPGQHSSYENAVYDIDYWKNTKKLSADKVVLGLPFYGYNFESATQIRSMVYRDIVAQYEGAEALDQVDNIYYNGQPTIRAKSELALEQAGGVMIWEITQDVSYSDERSLLRTIHEVIEPVHQEILSTGLGVEVDSIYPNPTYDFLVLPELGADDTVTIVTLQGAHVWSGMADTERQIDVRSLSSGIYLVRIENNQRVKSLRFIKE
ncbi:glycosyl hydrolase family 18 protein [Reichenbachiella agariperforans]|uniref:chitinase n=1 Tax=Reichenbachiella agariperforans TaxID=156994 RepID=A0A1M6V685_REIAG|nr:glycosyl hydrolase family 18 protein [Reichenbachiella agariperforans]MBU2912898.1 T9SS type A sorting domain-containing protein [Reichenbachiella agariperforans]SHK76948.1 Por secretion system C-terminal sorting domain-containing protein [Reichenbachiella agariperforans]